MPIEFRPLLNGILLTLEETPEKSSLLYVQQGEDLVRYGEVIAVGPEVRQKEIKVGVRVLASVTAGAELPQGMLIAEPAVLGVLTKDAA